MKPVVLDTSALLALLWQEPGWQTVAALLEAEDCRMSSVNLAEFVAKVQEKQPDPRQIQRLLDDLPIEVVAHDREQAFATGMLRGPTRHLGLSLGDRACLALARKEGACVYTADRPWLEVAAPLSLDIRCIRPQTA
ncbi:MAG: PIN domain-containing protein [Sideroxydans sp.]